MGFAALYPSYGLTARGIGTGQRFIPMAVRYSALADSLSDSETHPWYIFGSPAHRRVPEEASVTAMIRSMTLGLSALVLAPAALAALTAQDVQDAILGRQSFTAEQLAAMDLNGDGAVDAADLVVLGSPVVQAGFHDGSSVIVEGSAGSGPTVDFSAAFVGRLRYRVRELPNGTASTRQLVVSGTSAVIPMAADDDAVVTDARTFEVALLESTGYELGPRVFHTLVLEDNDAVWNGRYQNAGLSVHFQLKIVRNGGAVSGALVTDGFGIIPRNGEGDEWPLTSIALDDQQFSAEVQGVLVQEDASQTGVTMLRGFHFQANAGIEGDAVDPSRAISGRVTEWVTAGSDPYLDRTLTGGTFTLQKRIPILVAPDPVLELAQF